VEGVEQLVDGTGRGPAPQVREPEERIELVHERLPAQK
jgi:hypothetical protein